MSFLRRLFGGRSQRREIEADIEAFLAEKTQALVDSGLSEEEAGWQARREFGNVALMKELSGEEWSWRLVDGVAGALRYALRSLRRNPGFAVTVLLTLGLGIGTNAAIFNLLHAVVLRALPVPEAEQLRLLSVIKNHKNDEPIFSNPVLAEMQAEAGDKAALAGYSSIAPMRAVEGKSESGQPSVQLVSGNFFSLLGVRAQAGRLLAAGDEQASGTYPAVISGAYWTRRFGRDRAAIGQTIALNDTPVTIVGVAAESFFGMQPGSRPDYWLPVQAQQALRYQRNFWNSNGDATKPFIKQREIRWLSVVARVRERRAEGRITAALNNVYGRDMRREARGGSDPVQVRTLLQARVRLDAGEKGLGNLRESFAAPLTVLMCAAATVLLIACVNLASLALARVQSRRKEIAIRCSLGASRGRIIGHFAAEAVLLSLAGGALAVPLALGTSRVLMRWASGGEAMPLDVSMFWPVALFAGISALAAGAVFGLAPAFEALNFALADAMKAQAAAVKGMRLPWGRTLIAAQVAFSLVLVTAAALFVRTFLNYAEIALGFAPEHVLTVVVDPVGAHYPAEQLLPAYRRVLERIGEVPGIRSAAFATCGLAQGCKSISGVFIAGKPNEGRSLQENFVTPEYFATVGMHLLAGRMFEGRDTGKKPVLAVINETAAKRYFGEGKALGRRFGYGGDIERFEVTGVAADARVNDVHEEPAPMAYYSLEQMPGYAGIVEIRARGEVKSIESAVRRALREAAPGLPVMRVKTLTEQVGNNLLRERLMAWLASAFALLALGLACLGVYGVLSYATKRRTAEIGIRLALGARESSVRWMILREAALVVGVGIAVGVPVAAAAARLVQGLLYGLPTGDPASMVLGILSLLSIAGVAALVPAWRASRIDPNVALRYE